MGRYYFGTISGKFWFAVQDSDDASRFKIENNYPGPTRCFEYAECCCFVDDFIYNYCKKCNSSYEEHFNKLEEEDKKQYPLNTALIYKNNYIKYYFYDYELLYVTHKLKMIKKKLTIDFNKLGFKITRDSKGCIDYDVENFEYIDSIKDNNQIKLLARWCLGKQIELSIKEKGYCEIYCEI